MALTLQLQSQIARVDHRPTGPVHANVCDQNVGNGANDPSRIAHDDCPVRHVPGDDRSGADQGVLADRDSRQEHAAAAQACAMKDARGRPLPLQGWAAIDHPLVVHRDHPRAAEDVVLDDHATGYVDTALQRHVAADHDLALDVDVGPDGAAFADDSVTPNHDEVADP